MKMLILVCVLCAVVVAEQDELWLKCDIEGSLFSIACSDLLDMSKEDMIQVASALRLSESLAWHQGDPNEHETLTRHLIDKLIPEKYKPQPITVLDTFCSDLILSWEPKPYIVDPNNLPYSLWCDNSELKMEADGNLYLSGSFEPFLRILYEKHVLNGQKFQGQIILLTPERLTP